MRCAQNLETASCLYMPPPQKKASTDDMSTDSQAAAYGGGDASPPPVWFAQFLEKFYKLEERIESLVINRLEEISLKTEENEEKIDACCIQMDEVVSEVKKLKEEKKEILMKLDDLENRARRSNLVLHGVSEVPKENCYETVRAFFSDFVGVPQNDYAIERCHRTPTVIRDQRDGAAMRPRIIHVAFSTYASKEKVRKACVAKLKAVQSRFRDGKVFVSEDFSRRVLQMRKEKMDALKQLKDEGKKPFFLYPAKLAYRNKDGKLIFA